MPAKLKHVAIIMDGNGRWAQSRTHTRVWGHIRGSSIVSKIVEEADEIGLKALTLYAFSTENWSRPLAEVKTLFNLLKKFLIKEEARILKNKIRFKVIGDISRLPEVTQKIINSLENKTKDFDGLKLTFAFGYGGRAEIINAANQFIQENPGELLTEEKLASNLFLPEAGNVDLMIRTGGEQRISNFLLWQTAYAELYFTDTKWPDFTVEEFREICLEVSKRERRFGSVSAMSSLEESVLVGKDNKHSIEKSIRP